MNVTDAALCPYTIGFQLDQNISVVENLLVADQISGVISVINS